MTQICTRCKISKPLSEFNLHKDRNYPRRDCKECQFAVARSKFYKSLGLTVEQVEKLRKEQNNKCAICGQQPSKKRLSVDHNHKTGEVRGLLCNNCNAGIGHFKDDPKLLKKAIKYLEGEQKNC